MAIFGREAWRGNGDGFAVYFGFISRVAIFGSRRDADGRTELILRRPLSGLARTEARPGAVAFLAVMLGSVAFDGLSRSSWWFERLYNIEIKFSDPESAERAMMLLNLSALFLTVVIVATVYTVSVKIAEGVVGQRAAFRGIFVGSLIPIAIVYALSHYLSVLLVAHQFVIPLLSDPYDLGWNILGTAGSSRISPPEAEHDLVHAGHGARRRPRARARHGPRSRRRALTVPEGRAAYAVRDADADGDLHGRGDVAAVS